ncbi:nuclear transport factor 2 family protein [Allorhizocola rhizosphaerae]|uniref:nuclear transport factor 2 family protein n=1 Tax=Allorhizocola rhizosphaerae TaxID=1872709 RepID=UPI0013C2BC6A|nr:nuclear transport factor 2 family protein [Allorhizocola rhizosphaerae]
MRTLKRIVTAAVLLGALSACTTTPASSNVDGLETPAAAPESAGVAEQVAQRFLEAANAGDEAGVAALFAEDARFDSVGRIYSNRQEIMDRFLVPEVLRVGGRYESTGQQWQGDRLTVTYRFTTRSGGQERFTYAYLIRDGLIRDVIGRYI